MPTFLLGLLTVIVSTIVLSSSIRVIFVSGIPTFVNEFFTCPHNEILRSFFSLPDLSFVFQYRWLFYLFRRGKYCLETELLTV